MGKCTLLLLFNNTIYCVIVINLKAGFACDLISFSPHADADDGANKTMMVVITKKKMMMMIL